MDPLRPFATLIRSLWTTSKAQAKPPPRTANSTPSTVSATSIESQLRGRLRGLSPWHMARAREIFVETVLLYKLGSELEMDPEFPPLVRQVSTHLASIPAVNARLDELLQALQHDPTAR